MIRFDVPHWYSNDAPHTVRSVPAVHVPSPFVHTCTNTNTNHNDNHNDNNHVQVGPHSLPHSPATPAITLSFKHTHTQSTSRTAPVPP